MNTLNLQNIIAKLRLIITQVKRNSVLIFIVLVVGIYGFTFFKIQTLNNQQPTEEAVSSQVQAAHVPRIDPKTVEALNSLQDNSVSIKTLFDEARSNPFDQ